MVRFLEFGFELSEPCTESAKELGTGCGLAGLRGVPMNNIEEFYLGASCPYEPSGCMAYAT
jgi:hypothetical protein